jgi:hypothetical protein
MEKQTRKIFNFESVILIDLTLEKEGYHPDQFGKSSSKFIWATCRFCGEPSRIRKGFYNKSGSACHKECKWKEQSIAGSPFLDPKVQEKTRKTNLERYGVEHASQNKDIAERISKKKLSQESKEKMEKTSIERYGVTNVFQSEEVKQKIRDVNIERYGSASPIQTKEIQQKAKDTLLERYGVENIRQHPETLARAKITYAETIAKNEDDKYFRVNFVRSEGFWEEIAKGLSLREVCDKFGMPYDSISTAVSKPEFKERFQALYAYPKAQKQNEIADTIQKWGCQVLRNVTDVIFPLELDMYLPEHNLAVEFNGSYWHSEDYLEPKKARTKHSFKTKLCREKGIRLIHIFEATWDKKKDAYLALIRSVLKLNDIKIGARECTITTVSSAMFLNQHHLQGYGKKAIKCFNLVYNNQIVGTMTAAPHHRQEIEGKPIVLNRMCFEGGVTVQGGVSKLFSAFKEWAKGQGYDRVISWSDTSLTDGDAYKQLGFELTKDNGPDYFYWDVKNNCYRSKQSQQKKKTGCPDEITEREWCKSLGLFRIWDCGKKLWTYDLSVRLTK